MILDEHVDLEVYMPALGEWFWRELRDLGRVVPSKSSSDPDILMGCALWGDEYIARFTSLCLPSMMAPKNRAALAGRCRFVFFTDEKSYSGLYNLARDMTRAGFEALVYCIPSKIMDKVGDLVLNRYWLLGACQQLAIQMAGRWGMAFHALHPDHIHGEAYFENMWRLVGEYPGCGIAQTGISANIHTCVDDLQAFYLEDKSLAIPDVDLGDIGWRHVHKQTSANLMNGMSLTEGLPNSHFLMWVGKDKLYTFSCHMNAVYLTPEQTSTAPIHLFNAMDTMLPYYMGNGATVYVPDAHDGMTFIEVSDDNKAATSHRVGFVEWAATCWNTVHGSDMWMPFFETVCEIPIKEQTEYMEEDAIRSQHATMVEALKKAKEPVMKALKDGHEAMMAEKAAKDAAAAPKSNRAKKRHQMKKRNGLHGGINYHLGDAMGLD